MTTEPVSEATEHSGTDPNTDERLDRVENAIGRIETALAKLLPGSHAEAQERTEERLDRGSTVEEQVRAELDKAKREEAAKAAADAEKADHESVKDRLARLEETPPAPPRLRRTSLLGWGDGRG